MPFVAKLRSTNERVDITRFPEPRKAFRPDDVMCQLCEGAMIIKAGMIVRAHFAHRPLTECHSGFASHPESMEHRLGKLTIAQQLRAEMAEYSDAAIEYEVPITEVRRVVDVMVIFPNGWRVAHECQLAGITTQQLAKRSEDYLSAGIDVVWWLGKAANTMANRDWVIDHQGFALELHFSARNGGRDLPDVRGHGDAPDLGIWRDDSDATAIS